MNKTVQKAIDDRLSGLVWKADHKLSVLGALEEGRIVKRKVSAGLILAVVLALVTLTALAIAISNASFEKVIHMEAENGPIVTWELPEKLELIRLLEDMEYELPADALNRLDTDSLSGEEADALATTILDGLFGRIDAVSALDVIEKVKGPMYAWSLEDRAWYSEYMKEKGLLHEPWTDLMPGENDLKPEAVADIASQAIIDAFGIPKEELEALYPSLSFFTYSDRDVEPRWLLDFRNGEIIRYSVLLTRDGRITEDAAIGILTPRHAAEQQGLSLGDREKEAYIQSLEKEKGLRHTWTLEEQLILPGNHCLPDETTITPETAIAQAYQAMLENYGLAESDLEPYTPYVQLTIDSVKDNRMIKRYRVNFGTRTEANVCGATMDAYSGAIQGTYASAAVCKKE